MMKWIKIDVMIEGDGKPPLFVGSMLRGALGAALKRIVCINPSYQCEGCFAAKECLYYQFYGEKNEFRFFRLGIGLQPKNFDFAFYLFEEAIDSLPYILSAIKKAVEEQGFGRERKRMKIRQMSISNQIVYDGSAFQSLKEVVPNRLTIDSFCPDVEMEFRMPLRIKEHNRFAREEIALHTLINSIHSHYSKLKGDPSSLGYQVEGEIVDSTLKFEDMQRYSNRQKEGMSMGGLKGRMKIKGLNRKSYEYLKIGEIIGAGKQTAFGLGSYILKEVK